jgi:xanthine dehydrogenase accessory factor
MDILKELLNKADKGHKCVLATVVEKTGNGPVVVGGKLLISDCGQRLGSIGGGALEEMIITTCKAILEEGKSQTIYYDLSDCGGSTRIFYEYIEPRPSIFVFGAGNVGREVVKKAEGLGFKLLIIDPVCPTGLEFDCHYKNYMEVVQNSLSNESYVVISSSSHETDYAILKAITSSGIRPKYMGMLASPKKRKELVARLNREVGPLLCKLYSPIGLNIGGGKPSEIGISIIAQILRVKYGVARVEDMTLDD